MRENIKKLFRINTISSRITFITLAFLGALTFTLTAIVYQITRNWLEETAIANLEALASSRQLAVETYADTHFEKLAAFEQPDLEIKVENILNAISAEEENLKAELVSELQRKQLVDDSLAWVDILDLNGNVFISTFPNRIDIYYGDDEFYTEGLVHPYISDPFFDEGRIYIKLARPLHNAKNQVIAVLVLRYDASELLAIVGDYTGLGDTGETVLGTRIEDEIHFLAPLRFDPNLSEIPPAPANGERAKPMIHATSGQSGVTQAPDYRDANVVAAYRPILSTNWGIVVKQDVDETFASITQIQVALLIAFLSLFVLSTLFISPMIKRALLPLTELQEATNQVAKGHMDTRASIQYDDEIGDLAKTFNFMVDQLQEIQAQMEHSNEELEAFTYSVSHDLRSPLRGIDGFSRILQERFGPELPEQANNYINNIRTGAQKMDQLIQDLLALSRLGRKALNKVQLNPKKIIDQIVEEQKVQTPDRDMIIKVKDHTPIFMDPTLMKQVYTNLISNAIKFTQYREKAFIEIGEIQDADGITLQIEIQNERIYYVKDNGVGFDMNYANKLFGVFQRLHADEIFEGTGVGLAIVKRIIQRHDGQVSATGNIDNGATFYFTLPK